ncbi:MAG: outer membrane protein transport protein [Geothrix sp.]|nr:outer membrane protein transport protein [Geothrix sp.]
MSLHSRLTLTTLTLVAAAAFAPQAQASGFQLREQSVSAQGSSFAGVSATSSDISGAFFNPALLTQFSGWQFTSGASFIAMDAKFSEGVATRVNGSTISGPTTHGNAAVAGLVPNFGAMYSYSEDLKLGFLVNVPFGLPTEYDSNWMGRYHGLKTDLKTIDLAPTIAYRINSQWSVGASFVARWAEAELSNALDFALLSGLTPGTQDGKATVTGEAWQYGVRLGATFQPTEALRFGVGFHSAMTMAIKGDVAFDYPATLTGVPLATVQARGFKNGGGTADLKLPATYSLGFSYDINKAFTIQGEVSRSTWSRFDELRVKFADNVAPQALETVTEEKWKDTTFVSLGATWKASEAWTFRAGLGYDQSAVDDAYRTPRIPENTRTWVSFGAGHALSKSLSVDIAFSHLFIPDSNLNLTTTTSSTDPDFTRGNLSGTYAISVNIISAGMRYRF